MAECGRIPISCPDCGQEFQVAVTLQRRPDTEQDGMVLADLKIDDAAFTSEFTDHVMADPEAHPTFAIRDNEEG